MTFILGKCQWVMEEKARKGWESCQTTTQVPPCRRGRGSDGNDSDTGESKDGLPGQSESSGQGCHLRISHLRRLGPRPSPWCAQSWSRSSQQDVCLRAGAALGFRSPHPRSWSAVPPAAAGLHGCAKDHQRTEQGSIPPLSLKQGGGRGGEKPERAALRLF